jgi:hypothetical protein
MVSLPAKEVSSVAEHSRVTARSNRSTLLMISSAEASWMDWMFRNIQLARDSEGL